MATNNVDIDLTDVEVGNIIETVANQYLENNEEVN